MRHGELAFLIETRGQVAPKFARVTLVTLIALLVVMGLSACGSSGGALDGDVVANVGGTPITKPELSHWMSTLAGGDFYEIARGHSVPAGLVSEPANYTGCVSALRSVATSARKSQRTSTSAAPPQTDAQLLEKCRELYVALRLQTVAYLVESHWIINTAAKLGVRASDGEVRSMLEQVRTTEYPGRAQFQRFLTAARRSLADEMLVAKLDVVSRRLQQQIRAEGSKKVTVRLAEAGRALTAQTDCRPGYVVPHCRQFKKWTTVTRAPTVLLEQVATMTGIPCVNREACG